MTDKAVSVLNNEALTVKLIDLEKKINALTERVNNEQIIFQTLFQQVSKDLEDVWKKIYAVKGEKHGRHNEGNTNIKR